MKGLYYSELIEFQAFCGISMQITEVSQDLQEQSKPSPSDPWTHFLFQFFYFDLDTYLGMAQLLVAGWISLQPFDPPQMNLVACGRQMPTWRCCRSVHQAGWVPRGLFLQKSRVFQPAPLPSRSISQRCKTVLMFLSSNRITNWSLREHKNAVGTNWP